MIILSDTRLLRPMGAQNPQRLAHYINHYEMMYETKSSSDALSEPYFYGSHYSTPLGVVLYFLLRKEPFTQLHVCLQDGHFDHPDRLFHSVLIAVKSCLESLPEVKEVLPEWYYDESFLRNTNHQSFGIKQDMKEVSDVTLPSMGSSSLTPSQFISLNKQALENAYTTSLLHNWIDLVFGYKQTGMEAVKAYNVYYPLTYPDNIDLTEIDDKRTRDAVVIQASHFGQCPHPVFHSAHLKKRPNLQMRRNLREMLLLSNPSSIYEQNQPAWIGKYCRIHAISDYDAEVMKACYGNLRYVLGSSSQDQFPSSHLASISWPVESSYPWCITVDCNEYTELRLVKIVLDASQALSFNYKQNCFKLEVFTKDETWRTWPITAEMSMRTNEGIQTLLTTEPVVTRYWRIHILDIPFMQGFSFTSTSTRSAYTCGDVNRDLDSIPRVTLTQKPGPIVLRLDVMGIRYFPRVPPPGQILLNSESLIVTQMSVWFD